MFSLGFHLSSIALDSVYWAALCAAFFVLVVFSAVLFRPRDSVGLSILNLFMAPAAGVVVTAWLCSALLLGLLCSPVPPNHRWPRPPLS